MQCVVPPRLFLLKTREEPDVGRVHPGMALGVPWCFLVTFLGPSSAGALRFGGGCGLSSPSATSVSFSEWVMHVKLGGHVVSPNPHGSPPGAAPSQALGEPREASNEGRLGASSTAMCTFIPAAPAPPPAIPVLRVMVTARRCRSSGAGGGSGRCHEAFPWTESVCTPDWMEWLKIKRIYIYIFLYIQIYNIYIYLCPPDIYICHLSEKDKR